MSKSQSKPTDGGVAVVIVNYRTPQLTMRCLASLVAEGDLIPGLRVVVVDGGSGDDSAVELARAISGKTFHDWVSFLPLEVNGGYGWANNQAMLALSREPAPPEFIHVLNPDTEVTPGAVARLAQELRAYPRCAAAGSQLLTREGQPAASAFRFPSAGREFIGGAQSEKIRRLLGIGSIVVQADTSIECDWVTGASVMFRAEVLRQCGLFDDGFFLYFEEVELMHRMRARGWTIRHVPESRVIHVEGASTGVGAKTAERPLPDYWYNSRRRYLALTGGRRAMLAADAAWLVGHAIANLKKLAGKSPANSSVRAQDLMRAGLLAYGGEVQPSVPAWGDPPGRVPAWMGKG